MPDQRQAGVCHHTKTFVLELEAVINVQVPVETETFTHQSDVVDLFPAEGHAIGLHRIGIAAINFFVEMLHVGGAESPWPKDPYCRVIQMLSYRIQDVSGDLR